MRLVVARAVRPSTTCESKPSAHARRRSGECVVGEPGQRVRNFIHVDFRLVGSRGFRQTKNRIDDGRSSRSWRSSRLPRSPPLTLLRLGRRCHWSENAVRYARCGSAPGKPHGPCPWSAWAALSAIGRAPQRPVIELADGIAGIPELSRNSAVAGILQHADFLSALISQPISVEN